ncbi:hypothetical protein VE25_14860 [Devosia geojensis]|uniref:Glycosyltransferase subfamily 4-like N-terminal domain-containing protein n=1 Tax=Devosia geojensis TaxID=443610 RepID=A0A0F5FQB4_9HYPH|nr:WcaI family glycosyltransferase [Devosia geojensis]KKB11059.1 hypothetical protein VE25_14860 [Devosia geojensis]
MKLLVLGLNYAPEKVGTGVYTAGMAEAIARVGHEVRVIAGKPYYPAWRLVEGHRAFTFDGDREAGVEITRVPHYIPASPTGPRRLAHHASFAVFSAFPLIWQALTWRPDVVMAIAPSLAAAPAARIAAGLCGARSWLHVQDFEVETAFATGLIKADGYLGVFARAFEKRVLTGFGTLSTISPQMCAKLAEKGVPSDRIVELRNWADTEGIRPLATPSRYRQEWGIATPHVALYSGNIANKQGIDIVVEAARRLAHRTDLTFVVCGEGSNRADLTARVRGLANFRVHDLQPRERLNDLLGLATIHLLPQLAGAADLVLPSKLANMLASGRPVVATAAPGTGLAAEVEGCGLVTPPADAGAFADAIVRLMDDAGLHAHASAAARERAVERWSGEAILARLVPKLIDPTPAGYAPADERAGS